MILTRTPYRVSLFGGGTDYPVFFERHPGAVLGMAINQYCYVGVKTMPPGQLMSDGQTPIRYRVQYSKVDDCAKRADIQHPAVRNALAYMGIEEPLEFHIFGDLPGRSGLGGSSSFTVGLLLALQTHTTLNHRRIDRWKLANDAIALEQNIIHEAVGCQDQVFAAHGGLKHIAFRSATSRALRALDIPDHRLVELEHSLVLAFSGGMRDAHEMAAKQIAAIPNKHSVLLRMHDLAQIGTELLLSDQSLEDLGWMLNESWELKKSIAPEISNPAIDGLHDLAMRAGAMGGKLLGAGGGGFMLFYAPPAKMNGLRQAMKANKIPLVNFRVENSGAQVLIDN